MRSRSFGLGLYFGLAAIFVCLSPSRAIAADFTVQAAFPSYIVNGAANPTLVLTRGKTYTFAVTSPGHPFFIKTAQVIGNGSTFDAGLTNNGVENGTLVFQVPSTAPSTLFYQCAIHAPMTGVLQIVSAPPVAATSPALVALLGVAVLAAAVFVLKRNRAGLRRVVT